MSTCVHMTEHDVHTWTRLLMQHLGIIDHFIIYKVWMHSVRTEYLWISRPMRPEPRPSTPHCAAVVGALLHA